MHRILEDNPERAALFRDRLGEDIRIFATAEEFMEDLSTGVGVHDVLMLDHDLGEGKGDGMSVVDYLVEYPIELVNCIVIHSHNHTRAKEMQVRLRDAGYGVIIWPFDPKAFASSLQN